MCIYVLVLGRPVLHRLIISLLFLLLLGACGQVYIGYGVLYWADEDSTYENSAVVPILKESKIRKTYLVRQKDQKDRREIPNWRVKFFKRREEAEVYAEGLVKWRDSYGYSEKKWLPVREEADQKSRIIYKLQQDQVVKVVSRSAEKATEGAYENYWYQILTHDGSLGHCFGQFLTVFMAKEDPYKIAETFQAQDPLLDYILSQEWRPEFFTEMIDEKRFDLEKFRVDVGLFPLPEKSSIKLTTHRDTYSFSYDQIEKLGSSYIFEGTDLRIKVVNRQRIHVTYRNRKRQVTAVYLILEEDIEEIIREEHNRRAGIFEAFSGSTLSSSAYGTIFFDPNRTFTWNGCEKLAPLLDKNTDALKGYVGFPFYVGTRLQSAHEGIISFHLRGGGRLSFLYSQESGGVKFVHIDEADIEDMVASNVRVPPLILFFEKN